MKADHAVCRRALSFRDAQIKEQPARGRAGCSGSEPARGSRFWGTSETLDAARVGAARAVEGRRLLGSPVAAAQADIARRQGLALRSRIARVAIGEVRVEAIFREGNRAGADDEGGDQSNL